MVNRPLFSREILFDQLSQVLAALLIQGVHLVEQRLVLSLLHLALHYLLYLVPQLHPLVVFLLLLLAFKSLDVE